MQKKLTLMTTCKDVVVVDPAVYDGVDECDGLWYAYCKPFLPVDDAFSLPGFVSLHRYDGGSSEQGSVSHELARDAVPR